MRNAGLTLAFLTLVLCIGCGSGLRPVLATPEGTAQSTVAPTNPGTVLDRATRTPTNTLSNETSTAATLPGANETSTRPVLPATTPTPSPVPTFEVLELNASVIIGDTVLPVELAVNSVERTRGLSDRDSLEPGTGMLFIFEDREASSFWMRKVRFSLDFVWISEECRVVDITPDVPFPEPGTETSDLPSYSSAVPAAYNLEINGGEANLFGINVGDTVRFTGIPDHVGDTCER